ncbi:MAG: hypothetical protein NDJ90_00255 [Oligoflexia bacterium]|nr:hypothetical protein [Oligoflexia bacterium]
MRLARGMIVALAALWVMSAARAETVKMDLNEIQAYLDSVKATGNCLVETRRYQNEFHWERLSVKLTDRSTSDSAAAQLSDATLSGSTVDLSQAKLKRQPVQVFTYTKSYLQSQLSNLRDFVTVQLVTTADNMLVRASIIEESEERGWFSVKTKVISRFVCENR